MMKRTAAAALAVLVLATSVAAGQQGNPPSTPLAVSDVSGTVTFAGTFSTVHFTNDGTKDAVVRVFVTCQTIAGITTADVKAHVVKPGEGWGLTFSREEVPATLGACTRDVAAGFGFIGFAHVATAGQTTSLRWFATGGGSR